MQQQRRKRVVDGGGGGAGGRARRSCAAAILADRAPPVAVVGCFLCASLFLLVPPLLPRNRCVFLAAVTIHTAPARYMEDAASAFSARACLADPSSALSSSDEAAPPEPPAPPPPLDVESPDKSGGTHVPSTRTLSPSISCRNKEVKRLRTPHECFKKTQPGVSTLQQRNHRNWSPHGKAVHPTSITRL